MVQFTCGPRCVDVSSAPAVAFHCISVESLRSLLQTEKKRDIYSSRGIGGWVKTVARPEYRGPFSKRLQVPLLRILNCLVLKNAPSIP